MPEQLLVTHVESSIFDICSLSLQSMGKSTSSKLVISEACSAHWRKNLPVLGAEARVYAIDLLGYGYSDKPNPRYE